MSLHKLATELDETGRQTAAMLDGITEALNILSRQHPNPETAIRDAVGSIVTALQGQDRMEQRCQNMALAVRKFALLPPTATESDFQEI